MSRDHIIKDVDAIVIDIMTGDGDVFIDDEIREYNEKKKLYHVEKLKEVYNKVLYVQDQIQFAVLLQATIIGIVKWFKPEKAELFQKRISEQFIPKHHQFISQTWYWVVYFNVWYLIKFIAGIITALASS